MFSPLHLILTKVDSWPIFPDTFEFLGFCFSVLGCLGCQMLSETLQTWGNMGGWGGGRGAGGKPIIILCYCVACSHSPKSSQCLCLYLIGAPRTRPLLLRLVPPPPPPPPKSSSTPLCNLCSFREGGLPSLYSMLCY